MDFEEALGGKDDEHHGGQLASAGVDFEGDGQGWNSGQWESHPQPQGKASPLWEPSLKIFWLEGGLLRFRFWTVLLLVHYLSTSSNTIHTMYYYVLHL